MYVRLCLSIAFHISMCLGIVRSFLDSITSNVSRIHDVNDVFSQIRQRLSILPSFISYYSCTVCLALITTYLALGCVTDVLNTYPHRRTIIIDREKRFSSLLLLYTHTSVCRVIEQLWITCFVHNKEFDNFLKRIFYTSHSSHTLIFSFFCIT